MLAFYDFPAEHWAQTSTTNPIESTFSTVRLRTKRTRRWALPRVVVLYGSFELAVSLV